MARPLFLYKNRNVIERSFNDEMIGSICSVESNVLCCLCMEQSPMIMRHYWGSAEMERLR